MNYYTVFLTLLSKKAGQLLTANLVEKRYGVNPILVSDDEYNEVYKESEFATVMAFEFSCPFETTDVVKNIISDELKALTASFLSLVVLEGGEEVDFSWEGPEVVIPEGGITTKPVEDPPTRFNTID